MLSCIATKKKNIAFTTWQPHYHLKNTMKIKPKNWVWCGKCLEWLDAAEETSFVNKEERYLTFECDRCKTQSKSLLVLKHGRP
jgi:hypothetical protein